MKTQLELIKMIRKPATPPGRIIRPNKGAGYKRPKNVRWLPDD